MTKEAKWLWFSDCFGMATRKLQLALTRYGHPDALLSMTQAQIDCDLFLSPLQKRMVAAKNLSDCERIVAETLSKGYGILTFEDEEYPPLLKNIFAPPVILFYQGDLSLLCDHYLITMVGTRKPNQYGIDCAKKLAGEIAQEGGIVVSGLAVGIDAACHQAALASGAKTVAFLSAGLDSEYPLANRTLRKEIENNGLLLTEYILGTPSAAQHFSVRNRMLSGVSHATVIVQCGLRSGSMLTANHALSQNRDLFAVPGDIFNARSEGTNRLLSDGASVACSGREIVRRYQEIYRYSVDYPIQPAQELSLRIDASLTEEQKLIVRLLERQELSVDRLCELTNLEVYELLPILTTLEMLSVIKATAGANYKSLYSYS